MLKVQVLCCVVLGCRSCVVLEVQELCFVRGAGVVLCCVRGQELCCVRGAGVSVVLGVQVLCSVVMQVYFG